MIRLIISLTLITVICGAFLGFIYSVTKTPIEIAELKEKGMKIDIVLSPLDLDNNPVDNPYTYVDDNGDSFSGYLALIGNDTVGIAIENQGLGYAGYVKILTGIDLSNGEITGIEVISQEETPGLGARIVEPLFLDQFIGKSLTNSTLVNGNFAVVKDGGDIDAISGATITPRAVCKAVSKSLHNFTDMDFGGDK